MKREENKMVNDSELSVEHRWVELNQIIDSRFEIDSFGM